MRWVTSQLARRRSPIALGTAAALGLLLAGMVAAPGGASGAQPQQEVEGGPGPARVIYGLKFNAGTTTQRPPAALRPRAEDTDRAKINFRFSANFPAAAKGAYRAAADIWEALLTSAIPIEVEANWEKMGEYDAQGRIPLAEAVETGNYAGPKFPRPGTWYPIALANKLMSKDHNLTKAEIRSRFNSDVPNWYFGTDGLPPIGKYDFMSVALHELGHGLGFGGTMTVDAAGLGRWGMSPIGGTILLPNIYDRFAQNGAGTELLDISTFPNPSPKLGKQLTSNDLFLGGASATSAAGGVRPRLYAPVTWAQGTSYVHPDEATYPPGNANALMTPFIGRAEPIHNPGPIALGIMEDLGW